MAYIIENANVLKNNQLTKSSFLIKDDRIAALQSGFTHYKFIKMDAEPYIMTPTFCLLNTKIPLNGTFQEVKEYMIGKFLRKGCTTILTYVNISFENELMGKIKDTKTALINSPVDFTIGIKIPLHLLTQTLIRKCKKEKIPALFVEIKDANELENIPWGWIKEALFPFNFPLIPVIKSIVKKDVKSVLSNWKGIMDKEKIPAIFEELDEDVPLSVNVLNKIGLYPHKGSLMQGTELSYNLYLKGREINIVDEVNLFHYHGDRLVVTVHRGKVVRSGEKVLFKPGNGEYVKVRTPAYFSL